MKATRCLPIVLAHLAVMVTGTWADLGKSCSCDGSERVNMSRWMSKFTLLFHASFI